MTVTPAPSPNAAAASSGEVGLSSSGGAVIAPPRVQSKGEPGAGGLGPLGVELREVLELGDVLGRVVADEAIDLDQVAAGVAQVELHGPVLEHAHAVGEDRVDDTELARSAVDRQDVVHGEAE